MKVVKTIDEVRAQVKEWRAQGLTVGLVPTMGYLHEGHASLIDASHRDNDRTVVSDFVNPMQFGPTEDLESYGNTFLFSTQFDMMKVTFLGTGTSQGVPVIACNCGVCSSADSHDRRLRTSALLQIGDKNILIDIGPDFREQMLRTRTMHLDAILITHHHRDHVAGIDDIRSFNYVQNKPMDIYSGPITLDVLQRDYHYIFEKHQFSGLPEANLHPIGKDHTFEVADNIAVTPIAVMHKDLPIFGYRIGDFAYITDANYISDAEMAKLQGTKTLVINALRKQKHFSHFCLPEALEVIRRINPEKAYITHISHMMGLHAEVEIELPENVHLAYDGLTITA